MNGNVQLATDGQFNELRLAIMRAFDKLQGRLDGVSAQGFIGQPGELNEIVEQLLPVRKGTRLVPKVKRVIRPDFAEEFWGFPVTTLLQKFKPQREVNEDVLSVVCNPSFIVSRDTTSVAFCVLTPADMGFILGPTFDEVCTQKFLDEWSADNLKGQKLELCKGEDALMIEPWKVVGLKKSDSSYYWFVTQQFGKKVFLIRGTAKGYHSSQLLMFNTKLHPYIGLGDQLVFRVRGQE